MKRAEKRELAVRVIASVLTVIMLAGIVFGVVVYLV